MWTSVYNQIGDKIWIYLCAIAVLEALVIYTWQFRKLPGVIPYILLQVCKGVWLLSIVLASISTEYPVKMFWISLHEMMIVSTPYLWGLWVLQLSQPKRKIPFAVKYVIPGIIGSLWLVIMSNAWHGLYFREFWLDGQMAKYVLGPIAWVAIANSYLLCVASIVLSVRWVLNVNGLLRRQALWFTLPSAIALVGQILGFVPAAEAFSPQPLAFMLSGAIITWGYYRWRVYSILPLAQKVVARNMIEGLLVIDEQDYVVEINPAAKTMLDGLPADLGGKFQDITAAWPALAEVDNRPGSESVEAVRESPERQYHYELHMIPLQTSLGHSLGRIILLKDITQQKQSHVKIVEQQKALSILAERERLGRELHDGPGQLWSYINMQVEAARSFLGKKDLEQTHLLLENLAGFTQNMHVDLRESITGLQIPTAEQGMCQAIEEYLQWFQQNYRIEAKLIISHEFTAGLLAPITEVQLLRIVQEALTNVRKYAGAHHVKVIIGVNGSMAQLRVEDDGCGFERSVAAAKKGSFGLKIMQERAAEIGAQLSIQSTPNTGTKIIMQVPLTEIVSKEFGA